MIHSEATALHTADLLLQINAIKLNLATPFTWASGWRSPIYTDNRVTLSFPEVRTYLKEQFAELVKARFPTCELVAGVATAGIAHGALLADALNTPYCYVRSSPKAHGMTNLIEGNALAGQKTVVVEDLISTGGSSLNAVSALRNAGCDVIGLVAIFSYGFDKAEQNFRDARCAYYTLTDYHRVIDKALQRNFIGAGELESLRAWRQRPEAWHQSV